MLVEIDEKQTIPLPQLIPIKIGTNDSCDINLASQTTDEPQIMCSITNDKLVCVLDVFTPLINILVNNIPVTQKAIVHSGDVIHINSQVLKIINDEKLPAECEISFRLNKPQNLKNHLVSGVSGLRSFNEDSNGKLFLVGAKNSYTHRSKIDDDTPFSVSNIGNHLILLCKKGDSININGNKANYVTLRNGDIITTNHSKYSVESPGTSAFSKYEELGSLNSQFSDDDLIDDLSGLDKNQSFFKKHLWLITLFTGMSLIALTLYILKNIK